MNLGFFHAHPLVLTHFTLVLSEGTHHTIHPCPRNGTWLGPREVQEPPQSYKTCPKGDTSTTIIMNNNIMNNNTSHYQQRTISSSHYQQPHPLSTTTTSTHYQQQQQYHYQQHHLTTLAIIINKHLIISNIVHHYHNCNIDIILWPSWAGGSLNIIAKNLPPPN